MSSIDIEFDEDSFPAQIDVDLGSKRKKVHVSMFGSNGRKVHPAHTNPVPVNTEEYKVDKHHEHNENDLLDLQLKHHLESLLGKDENENLAVPELTAGEPILGGSHASKLLEMLENVYHPEHQQNIHNKSMGELNKILETEEELLGNIGKEESSSGQSSASCLTTAALPEEIVVFDEKAILAEVGNKPETRNKSEVIGLESLEVANGQNVDYSHAYLPTADIFGGLKKKMTQEVTSKNKKCKRRELLKLPHEGQVFEEVHGDLKFLPEHPHKPETVIKSFEGYEHLPSEEEKSPSVLEQMENVHNKIIALSGEQPMGVANHPLVVLGKNDEHVLHLGETSAGHSLSSKIENSVKPMDNITDMPHIGKIFEVFHKTQEGAFEKISSAEPTAEATPGVLPEGKEEKASFVEEKIEINAEQKVVNGNHSEENKERLDHELRHGSDHMMVLGHHPSEETNAVAEHHTEHYSESTTTTTITTTTATTTTNTATEEIYIKAGEIMANKDLLQHPEKINSVAADSQILDILNNGEDKNVTFKDAETILSEINNRIENAVNMKSDMAYPLLVEMKRRAGTVPTRSASVTSARVMKKQKRLNYNPNYRENAVRRKWNVLNQNNPVPYDDYSRSAWNPAGNSYGKDEYELAGKSGADVDYPNYYYYEMPEKVEQELGENAVNRNGRNFAPGIGKKNEYIFPPAYGSDAQNRIQRVGLSDVLPQRGSLPSGSSRYTGMQDANNLAELNRSPRVKTTQEEKNLKHDDLRKQFKPLKTAMEETPFQSSKNSSSSGVFILYRTREPESTTGNVADILKRASFAVRRRQLPRHYKRDMRRRREKPRKITLSHKVSETT